MTRQRVGPGGIELAPSPAAPSERISILAIDSGLASLGLCVVAGHLEGGVAGLRVEVLEVFKTQKADKKARRKIRVSTDDHRRIDEFMDRVLNQIRKAKPTVLVVEWYAPMIRSAKSQTGANGWKAALVVGAVLGVGRALGIPVLEQLSGDKRQLGKDFGAKVVSGGKEDVEAWLSKHLPGFKQAIAKIAKSHREHPTDAAAHAVLALREVCERRLEAAL